MKGVIYIVRCLNLFTMGYYSTPDKAVKAVEKEILENKWVMDSASKERALIDLKKKIDVVKIRYMGLNFKDDQANFFIYKVKLNERV